LHKSGIENGEHPSTGSGASEQRLIKPNICKKSIIDDKSHFGDEVQQYERKRKAFIEATDKLICIKHWIFISSMRGSWELGVGSWELGKR
jgi:hypothetical protein